MQFYLRKSTFFIRFKLVIFAEFSFFPTVLSFMKNVTLLQRAMKMRKNTWTLRWRKNKNGGNHPSAPDSSCSIIVNVATRRVLSEYTVMKRCFFFRWAEIVSDLERVNKILIILFFLWFLRLTTEIQHNEKIAACQSGSFSEPIKPDKNGFLITKIFWNSAALY